MIYIFCIYMLDKWTQRSAFTVYFVMVLRLLFCCIDSFIVKELYSEGLKNVMMLAHFFQNLHFLLFLGFGGPNEMPGQVG